MQSPDVYAEMVNLARASDRRDRMRAELAAAKVDCLFEPGVDMNEHPLSDLLNECSASGPLGAFPIPHMAATLSHARIWERFLATNKSYCLVFEDDIFISPELERWLADLDWWPEDADIIKLEHWPVAKNLVLVEKAPNAHVHGRRLARIFTRHMGAAGYMLSRKAAQALVDAKPYDVVIDHLLFNQTISRTARQMRIYQVIPALVRQGNVPSTKQYQMPKIRDTLKTATLAYRARRLRAEAAYPLSTYGRLLLGKAKLEPIPFVAEMRLERNVIETHESV